MIVLCRVSLVENDGVCWHKEGIVQRTETMRQQATRAAGGCWRKGGGLIYVNTMWHTELRSHSTDRALRTDFTRFGTVLPL